MRVGAAASIQMMKASTKSSPNTSNNLICYKISIFSFILKIINVFNIRKNEEII